MRSLIRKLIYLVAVALLCFVPGAVAQSDVSMKLINGGTDVPIPMKVVSDSDLIPVTHSDGKPVTVGAKRRWRSYRARSDRDRSTGI